MIIILAGGTKRTQTSDIAKAIEIAKQFQEERTMHKAKPKLRRFDPVNYLKSEKDMALYLQACLEQGGDDPAFIAAAPGDIARARGISDLAEKTGMTRAGLYKAFSKDGNPSFGAVLKVLRAIGLELHVSPQR